MHAAINEAGDAGILFVVAAGNDSWDNDVASYYPANYECTGSDGQRGWDCLISVASINSDGFKSSWSNWGSTKVDM